MHRLAITCAIVSFFCTAFVSPPLANAVTLSPGDLLVTGLLNSTLYVVDQNTGDRSVLSDFSTGSGPFFFQPFDVTMDRNGRILVSDDMRAVVFSVDLATGDRTVVSGDITGPIGTGPAFEGPRGLAVADDGRIVVADADVAAIFSIDPNSGDRTIISGSGIGSGPDFLTVQEIAIEPTGNILVTDNFTEQVFSVDPATGDRTIVSGPSVGMGPSFRPTGMTLDADGDIIVVDSKFGGLMRVDRSTGNRTVLGSTFFPFRLALAPDGRIVATTGGEVFLVHPVTGDLTVISGPGVGSGPDLVSAFGVFVVTVPELITIALDIKPGSDPNSVNLNSKGVLPVAILSTDDFDVLDVDINTLLFGDPLLLDNGGTAVNPLRSAFEDVSGDGLLDLSLKFSMAEMVEFEALGPDTIEGLLTGETLDGTPFAGTDSIRIVPSIWSNRNSRHLQLSDNPEPSTLTLAVLALVSILAHGRRRRRA